jgi:thiamine-phosphate pyrophosphorylase
LLWLMTDERLGEGLWGALRRLPPGSGVVFRHYSLPPRARARLFVAVRRRARARGCVVLSAGGLLPGADGVHGRGLGRGLRSWPAHDRREAIAGVRAGAGLLFVSPVFATRSHPEADGVGPARAGRVARGLRIKVVALGGMDAQRFRGMRARGFDGWAGIDAWV